MSLTAATNDDQGMRPSQTIPLSPRPLSPSLTSPADPSDVEAATLQHRRPPAVEDSEFGLESERPAYDDEVAEELEGDYDYAKNAYYNEDDEGDDGEVDVDEDGERGPEEQSYDEALEDERFDTDDAAAEQEEAFES